jgi:tRNA (cytidine32/uridine32-2'-O)-methyltransferase
MRAILDQDGVMSLRVVLVRTHNPGNIGAAARAAKNFGAEIALLGPRTDPAHPDAISFASGAEDLLRRVKSMAAWGEVVSEADDVVALSSLRGRVPRGLPPPVCFEEISSSLRRGRRIALVFGPERGGLTTEELRQCDARLRIEARKEFPTLNLAQSVAIALSKLYPFEAPRRRRGTTGAKSEAATAKEMRRLLTFFKETLSSAGYPGRGHSKEVVAEIESFLRRGKPTSREVTLLLGALAALGRALGVERFGRGSKRRGRPRPSPSP